MIVAVIVIVLLILAAVLFRKEEKLNISEEQKIFQTTQKFSTQYFSGHPAITKGEYVYLVKNEDKINIVERKLYSDNPPYNMIASIPFNDIVSVESEDLSGIEKKFSLGRFMVIGVYAFAWLKKEPKEKSFLIIKWNDGGIPQTIIFCNDEKGSLKEVSVARNAILYWIQESKSFSS